MRIIETPFKEHVDLRKIRAREATMKPPGTYGFNRIKKAYKQGAKKRGYEFSLTDMDLHRLFEGNCFYCKMPPSKIQTGDIRYSKIGLKNAEYIYNGIDRINNPIGYTPNNSVSCCTICNYAKHTKTYKEFLEWIDSLVINRMNYLGFETSIGFKNIAIKQKKNICKSRLDANIESEIIRGIIRPIPLIASNMSSVINSDFYIQLYQLGAFGVLHRALDPSLYSQEVRKVAASCEHVAFSLGVQESDKDLLDLLVSNGGNIAVIDIAHGYSDPVIEFGKYIKNKYPHLKVVLGNTTNPNMLNEVADFADAIKIGIANGAGCETKNTAGCTEGQFSVILKFKELSKKLGIPTISDGGIKEPADFTKAVLGGTNSVMAGSIFARCSESAAEIISTNEGPKKVYFGMASRKSQTDWKGGLKSGTCPEGKTVLLEPGESVINLLERYSGALRSGITYAGGNSIKSAQDIVEFVKLV